MVIYFVIYVALLRARDTINFTPREATFNPGRTLGMGSWSLTTTRERPDLTKLQSSAFKV